MDKTLESSEKSEDVSIMDKIDMKLKEFADIKVDYASRHLHHMPLNYEDSVMLLRPLVQTLKSFHTALTQDLSSYKDACIKVNKGRYYHLCGKVYNLWEDNAVEALPYFEKAAKFSPHKTEVWNELGDCYLSAGNVAMAKNCFNEALRREENCWSYRSWSVVCRKEASDGIDIKKSVDDGVVYAMKALKVDATDSYSWMILGNAYMAGFLVTKKDGGLYPSKPLQAYFQAEKNNGRFPELYFNKAIALLYAENFAQCLEAFEESLRRDPLWKLAWLKYYTVRTYIQKLHQFCHNKGNLRLKKISYYINALNREANLIVSTKYTCVILSELITGVNPSKLLLGKVLWSYEIDPTFPFTFGIVDGFVNFAVVTVFNLKTGVGVKIGDTIAIFNPNYSANQLSILDEDLLIYKIRVDSPKDMRVNGKPLPERHIGQSLSVTKCE